VGGDFPPSTNKTHCETMSTAKHRQKEYRKRTEVQKSIERFSGTEGIDYVTCRLCGMRGVQIDSRHLRNRHNMTKSYYKKLFIGAPIISEYKINLQRKIALGNKANVGRRFPKEHRMRLAESKIGSKNPFYSKSHSQSVIEKAKEKRKSTLLAKYGVENPMHISSVRDKISKLAVERVISGNCRYRIGKSGFYYSIKTKKRIFYRSSYELKFINMLENDSSVYKYVYEPFYIKYTYNGNQHRYVPDFIINDKYIVEIKPGAMLEDGKTKAKINAGREYAKSNGYIFNVMTCEEIDRLI